MKLLKSGKSIDEGFYFIFDKSIDEGLSIILRISFNEGRVKATCYPNIRKHNVPFF